MQDYGLPEILKTGQNELEIIDFRLYEDREEGLYEWILGVNVAKVREVLRIPPHKSPKYAKRDRRNG